MRIWGSFLGNCPKHLDDVQDKGSRVRNDRITQAMIDTQLADARERFGPKWIVWVGEADEHP